MMLHLNSQKDLLESAKASGEVPKLTEKMNAIIKKVREDGTDRWVLVDYVKQ